MIFVLCWTLFGIVNAGLTIQNQKSDNLENILSKLTSSIQDLSSQVAILNHKIDSTAQKTEELGFRMDQWVQTQKDDCNKIAKRRFKRQTYSGGTIGFPDDKTSDDPRERSVQRTTDDVGKTVEITGKKILDVLSRISESLAQHRFDLYALQNLSRPGFDKILSNVNTLVRTKDQQDKGIDNLIDKIEDLIQKVSVGGGGGSSADLQKILDKLEELTAGTGVINPRESDLAGVIERLEVIKGSVSQWQPILDRIDFINGRLGENTAIMDKLDALRSKINDCVPRG